ncbi:MAG TPA: di-heme oxidoredictase family protein, partial [Kofleriaceae bacterium]|nr:di-heme oxidoredictase family protein [Kofleriaceae bacterium]
EALQAAPGVTDPGPRPGPAGAGGPYAGLGSAEQARFASARAVFEEVDSVSGTIESGLGLGPTFNGNSCAQCHAEPDVGGSSPHPRLGQVLEPNPQLGLATLDRVPGGAQAVPSFLAADGPVREARFVTNPDGTPDGGVHGLYTIAGRSDAPGCVLAQPDFASELAAGNVIFRIPTPTFGGGLLEAVPDDALAQNLAAHGHAKQQAGIAGALNHSGNDGTVTRFGWKAQNKSLLVFAGEAYNVEQGVSNELFPNERATVPGCEPNAQPEDASSDEEAADTTNFAAFMRLSAPPTPTTGSPSELRGQEVFGSIGCVYCHSDTLTTGSSRFTGMSNVEIHPYSDLALHHMGSGLADGVAQGAASGDQFRTAPLWGVGQRIFFLHDGRATPDNGGLVRAIIAHAGQGSEANTVIRRFTRLPPSDQQAVVDFLRSL